MLSPKLSALRVGAAACLLLGPALLPMIHAADDTVATVVAARTGNGYKREKLKDGSFKPEFYALSNGGRIYGTGSDITVDRVTYPEVAEITMRLLAGQNYRYAQNREQAKLLLMLQWGSTIGFNRDNYSQQVNIVAGAMAAVKAAGADGGAAVLAAKENLENELLKLHMQNRARDQFNLPNAKVLGYLDEINDADGIQRWAGGGDHYNDLLADIEESRYYIVISAYDFTELTKHDKKKLLWQTRVSVRTPGNSFTDSYAAMLKSASRYFGQDSRKLIRGEESKGMVELGDLKFLGEAKEAKPTTEDKK